MKQLKRVQKWMEWRAIEIKDLVIIGIALSMLLTVTGFGMYVMALILAAMVSP